MEALFSRSEKFSRIGALCAHSHYLILEKVSAEHKKTPGRVFDRGLGKDFQDCFLKGHDLFLALRPCQRRYLFDFTGYQRV